MLRIILSTVLSTSSLHSSCTFILLLCRTCNRLFFEMKVKFLSQYWNLGFTCQCNVRNNFPTTEQSYCVSGLYPSLALIHTASRHAESYFFPNTMQQFGGNWDTLIGIQCSSFKSNFLIIQQILWCLIWSI